MNKSEIIDMFQKAKRKKISLDINEKNLEMIDELAKILGVKRSKVLDSLIICGVWADVKYCIQIWENMKKKKTSKEYKDKEKREKIEKLIGELKKFKKKWNLGDIPSEYQ